MLNRTFCLFLLAILSSSCDYFSTQTKPAAVARVNDDYLYEDEIADIVSIDASKEDSAMIVRNYIDRWANNKILISAAEINLNQDKQDELNKLVDQYKIDLYAKAYLEEVVKQSVDTAITEQEIENYYSENKSNFKTNGKLVRLRYIHLQKDNPKFKSIEQKFNNYQPADAAFLENTKLQFRKFALNDSVWVEMNQVYDKLPFINPENANQYIVAGKFFRYDDGDQAYLVKITHVLDRNQVAPLQFVKPTLREVILNKRKLELIKKFEKDITDDAIKSKKYEIYK